MLDSVYHMTFIMRFYRLKCVFISMKICVVVTDVVMTLFVPTESVILRVVITLFYDMTLLTE